MRYFLWVALFILFLWPVATTAQNDEMLTRLPDCAFSEQVPANLNVGAVVLNMDTGLGCAENIDDTFNVASVPKIFIAAAFYDAVAAGRFNLLTRMQFTREYWMGGRFACLDEPQIGLSYSYQQLVEFMINCSDNAATWMVMDIIGWDHVNAYLDRIGLDELVGDVLPYAFVDRLKLSFLDERWMDVPVSMATRFYREGRTDGLSAYFDRIPSRPNSEQQNEINQQYFESYDYNTATPRAVAQFFLQLRTDLLSTGAERGVAENVLDVMLYTQRLYSTQALPGTVLVAGKNGFDRGLLAEVSVVVSSLSPRTMNGLVLVFSQQASVGGDLSDLPGPFSGRLNGLHQQFAPQISTLLYPNTRPPRLQSGAVSTVVLNVSSAIESCWFPFFDSGFDTQEVPILDRCFSQLAPRITYPVGQELALGVTLLNLNQRDTRVVMIFTAPDGRIFSYQTDRQGLNHAAIYWLHPLDMGGRWQIEVYVNLQLAFQNSIIAQQ